MAEAARIIGSGNALTQIPQNEPPGLRAKFAEVADSSAVELDTPGRHHALPSGALLKLSLKALECDAGPTARQAAAREIIVLDIFDLP
jgi:hypothetical protein